MNQHSLGNIGNIYQLLGDYPQALDYQEQSLAITRELDDRVGEASSLCKITLTSAPDSQSTSAGDSH
ncbi:MAG: tetratricopeptide repeat protein [Cyanobacteria bacterium J06656_5]